MKDNLNYDIYDVLWAPLRALSPKKIFTMTFFLIISLLIYDIFSYIAFAIDGEKLSIIWKVYDFFPFFHIILKSPLAKIVFGVGLFVCTIIVMIGLFSVSAMEIEKIRGNPFLSIKQSIKFGFQRLNQMLLAELAIVMFLLFVVILFWLFGLLGRIPIVGEWLVALFFLFPGFIVAIFAVFIFVVFQMSVILLPAVTAAERKGETFNSILETFSTIIRQPFRWVGYTAYSLVAAKLAGFVYAYTCYRAVQFSVLSASMLGGEKIERLTRSGFSHLPIDSSFVKYMFNIFPGFDFSFSLAQWSRGGTEQAAGYLMSIMLFLIFASVIGYMFSVIATAQASGFVAIRKIKDNYKIGDEKPLFAEQILDK
ncbi:MAG: hypothetical protein U9N54_07520 [candidate division Zixibacteria bacterium]|nr:hypothetical protein [candidate division Zixibacteria bacterium]